MLRSVRGACSLHSRVTLRRVKAPDFGLCPKALASFGSIAARRLVSSSAQQAPITNDVASTGSLGGVQDDKESIEWLPLPRGLTPRRALLLLSVPVAPSHWPSHLELASPLLARLTRELKSRSIAVNVIYDGNGTETFFSDKEAYSARAFWPDGHIEQWEALSRDSIDGAFLSRFDREAAINAATPLASRSPLEAKEILVCTHGSRDCRCSDRGGALVHALRAEIDGQDMGDKIVVREIAHVGGHKYAANAILLPSLDMLSNLTTEYAPALVSHIVHGSPADSGVWQHWRGRYGLSEEDQARLWAQVDPGSAPASVELPPSANKSAADSQQKVSLRFRTFEGEEKLVEASMGDTLLHVGKGAGLPALEGVCGGHLECATCHLYIPASAPVEPPSEDELDMLGYALGYREGESRLGCQIKMDAKFAEWAKDGVISLPRF